MIHALLVPVCTLLAGPLPSPDWAPDAEAGSLAVFVQPGASEVELAFEERSLPEIRQMAAELGVGVSVLDAREGAPGAVGITPLLVYQNHRGRSIYQGRTTTLERVRNFLRTARRAPQRDVVDEREDLPVLELGRARAASPLKITPLAGKRPEGHDDAAFEAEVRAGLARGFEGYRFTERARLGRSDRLFYMDLHPYLADDGQLFLSLEVYSQFHCKEPIFSRLSEPLGGPWEERERIFAEAAAVLEQAVEANIADSSRGDGFTPLPADVAIATWEDLGLALPPAPPRSATSADVDTLPRAWRLVPPRPTDPPRVQFHFPSPMDGLRGEVGTVRGELVLGEGLAFAGATGRVEADAATVTLGEVDLDKFVHGDSMLDVSSHPRATFELESFATDAERPAFGELATGTASGRFEMMGLEVPVTLRFQLEPVIGADDRPRLLVDGTFDLRIREPFGLSGPGGPEPANSTLVYEISFELEPAD